MAKKKRRKQKTSRNIASASPKVSPANTGAKANATDEEKRGYEARLQKRLFILREKFKSRTIVIPKDPQIEKSLLAMRLAPDGSVDLNTVDGIVRSIALAVEGIHERDELKKATSLAEIQSTYFSFLENNFG